MKYGLDPSGTIDIATLGYLRALPRGEAPAQVPPKQVKASPSRPQGKPAQPAERANAQAVALGNNAVPLLVLALLGGLGAAAVWPRRRQRLAGP
jgi:hypothetical protein